MEAIIEQCTSEKNTQDKWDLILKICEEHATKEPKACIKAICKRVFHKNPNVSVRAITLLDACSKNSGKAFNRELASREFSQLVKNKFTTLQRVPCLKLIEVMEKWSEEFKSDSEFALLTSLFSWIRNEHPELVQQMQEEKQSAKAGRSEQVAVHIQAKEEEELAKAIALSLKETENKKSSGVGSSHTATRVQTNYPITSTSLRDGPYAEHNRSTTAHMNDVPAGAPRSVPLQAKGRVRALYDFEAAEDNELTFKAGELILLLDDSDENWWRGSNHRGEGLFPAQFVKVEKDDAPSRNVTFNESVTVATIVDHTPSKESVPVCLDGRKLDACLQLINSVDPTGEFRADPPELAQLEAECYAMAPLIDPELEKVDKRVLMLTELNQRLMDAFQQYHDLMSRAPLPLNYYSGPPGVYMSSGGQMAAANQPTLMMRPGMPPMQLMQPIGTTITGHSLTQPDYHTGAISAYSVAGVATYPPGVQQPQSSAYMPLTSTTQPSPGLANNTGAPNYYPTMLQTTSPQHGNQQPQQQTMMQGPTNPNDYSVDCTYGGPNVIDPDYTMSTTQPQSTLTYSDPNQQQTTYFPSGYAANSNSVLNDAGYRHSSLVSAPEPAE